MSVIILAHIIGDFYLQTDKIAEKRRIPICIWQYIVYFIQLWLA